jgi:RNA polymerase sigma factor (sigma-70 family)
MQFGRERPFEEIVRRYAGMVYSVCLRVTKDKHDAEDATQAVFLTLALQAKRGAQIKALGPWLQQVAKRLSLDLRRSKSRRQNRETRHHQEQMLRREDAIAACGSGPQAADLDELKTILHEELEKLPTKYRLPLILHYFGGLSREEMAAELGCKPSTLGVRIFRGREMLAGRLSGRGVNLTTAALAVALVYTIKSVISDAMVATTSHAASALVAGGSGISPDVAGMISSRVLGLSRRAAGAMVIGKVKLATIVIALACTSLGAGAKAFGMLPQINVQQMISNQLHRLLRPFFEPLNVQLRVDATQKPADHLAGIQTTKLPASAVVDTRWDLATHQNFQVPPVATAGSKTSVDANSTKPHESDAPIVVAAASDRLSPTSPHTPPLDAALVATTASTPTAHVATANDATASSGVAGSSNKDSSAPTKNMSDVDSSNAGKAVSPVLASAGGGGSGLFGSTADAFTLPPSFTSIDQSSSSSMPTVVRNTIGLRVGPAISKTTAGHFTPQASQTVRIPTTGSGSIIASSDGVLRGWGTAATGGTLEVCGKVVADGQGVDRTLNLDSFHTIETDTATPSITVGDSSASVSASFDIGNSTTTTTTAVVPGAGFYAAHHGRLTLPLQASADGKTLTWGEEPSKSKLDLVNSVRLQSVNVDSTSLSGAHELPKVLALLSPDREDAPTLAGMIGVPVGLWQVDPAAGYIENADLTVRYNDSLVSSLGASESSVQLWTFGDGTWSSVDPLTVSLDTTDHVISGEAKDFSYFAVAVAPAGGVDAMQMVASPAAEPVPGVPEPAASSLLILSGAGLLLRRRRAKATPVRL